MFNLVLGVILLVCIVLGSYWEVLYARANYPKSWRWRTLLFSIGCVNGGLAVHLVVVGVNNEFLPPLILVGSLLFGGIGFAWLFPIKMRYWIPPKRKQS